MRSFRSRLIKKISLLICAGIAVLIVFLFYTAGDFFLDYLDRQLGIDISYKNHSGFVSCFLLRSIVLEDPAFIVKGSGVSIMCESAYIEPDFGHTLDKGVINLKCALTAPVFLQDGKRVNVLLTDLPGMDKIAAFLNKTDIGAYERLYCNFELLEDSIRVRNFQLFNSNIKLVLSGMLVKDSSIKINLKLYLSPVIVDSMPEELKDLLVEKGAGWRGLTIKLAGDQKSGSLKLETERIRFQFGEILER